MSRNLMRKSVFAELRGVSCSRVSQWIAEGKIGPDAIVGAGQRAMIDAPLALKQLQDRIDQHSAQRLSQASSDLVQALFLWPSCVAVPMAAELSVDAVCLEIILAKHMREHFKELAKFEPKSSRFVAGL